MIEDAELLRRYAEEKSEEAFTLLVQRRIDLVYAAAWRRVGDAHLAEEITQTVFVTLARKAATLARHPVLSGWLHRSTQFAAIDARRARRLREQREQEAEIMNDDAALGAGDWREIRPVIDSLLDRLSAADRDAVMLRFFEGQSFAAMGEKLNLSEDAARRRVDRALEKLQVLFARRGATSTTAALGVALAQQVSMAAPTGLAASVTGAALAGAGIAGGGAGAWLTFFTMSKIKVGIVGAIVATIAVTGVVELRANRELRAELGALSAGDDEVVRLQRENRQVGAAMATLGATNPEVAELTRLRARLSSLKARPDGVIESAIRPPQNRGRATARAAMETFCWAIDRQDLDLVGSFINFSDDTPENRAAFMAKFSPAVQARYATPERLCAAAFFSVGYPNPDPQVAVQIFSIAEDHGPDQVKIKIWGRNASGAEWLGGDTYVKKGEGWTAKPVSLTKAAVITFAVSRLDPASGAVVPQK